MLNQAFWRTWVERYEEGREDLVPISELGYEGSILFDEQVWTELAELAEDVFAQLTENHEDMDEE